MSTKKYKYSLYIFTRDLRVHDNTTFINAVKNSEYLFPIFIFNPDQIIKNIYLSNNGIQFMIESLIDLDKMLKNNYNCGLTYYYGNYIDIIKELITEYTFDGVFITFDYTPYARIRTKSIAKLIDDENILIKKSKENNTITFITMEDYLLYPVGSITVQNNLIENREKVYVKFTPYYINATTNHKSALRPVDLSVGKIKKVSNVKLKKYPTITIKSTNTSFKITVNSNTITFMKNTEIFIHGGRTLALLQLKSAVKSQIKYAKTKNILIKKVANEFSLHTTSNLSAYIKFGCVSIREVFNAFKNNKDYQRQLYWREFYYNIAYSHPYVFGKPLKSVYANIKWNNDNTLFKHWTNGTTGFPIIDAAMISLNTTGFMHNRARLFTSGFLVKILLIDWRLGEKYFATKLIDYDPAVNNGNWQWTAGSGADSQPYFRIFNPILQSKKYDHECIYIKYWLPQLNNIPNKHLHNWEKYHTEYKDISYPAPCVKYRERKKITIETYNNIFH